MRIIAVILAMVLTGCGSGPARIAESGPSPDLPRIVSINPCVDAVLMEVADPAQIVAISHYSHDTRATSIPLAQAMRYPATSGTAEEVVALRPDLVIAGGHVEPSTINALTRMRIPLIQAGVANSIAESIAQVRTIAAGIGRRQQGEDLVARIEMAVQRAKPADDRMIPALIWQGGGMVPGTGTLASELLLRTGFRNMSADYGLEQWDVLPLEPLIAQPPRLLLSVGADGRGDRMLNHPALDHLRGKIAVRRFPERLMTCAGPTIIDAVGHLARVRQTIS